MTKALGMIRFPLTRRTRPQRTNNYKLRMRTNMEASNPPRLTTKVENSHK